MSEDHSPFSSTIKNNLSDKSADKRKQAAQDISDAVRALVRGSTQTAFTAAHGEGPEEQVAGLIRCLVEEYCRSGYPARRKGGLLALAQTAIALERRQVQAFVDKLVPPVLICFSDEDSGVRYNACETFYNIAKVARQGILPFFNDVFDGLCRLYADVEQQVKDGGQCLDRLIRDIVTESRDFSYATFVPMLTTRIRVMNPFVRQLVLGWIVLLDSVPKVDMISYFPQFLEGLFSILASDNRDIRHSAEVCLAELLGEIKGSPPARAQRAIADAAPTVARCCQAGERRPEDNYVRLTALHWLLELVRLQVEPELFTLSDHEACTSPPPELAGPVGPRQVSGGLQLMIPSSSSSSLQNRQLKRGEQRGDVDVEIVMRYEMAARPRNADGDVERVVNFRHGRTRSHGESPKLPRQQVREHHGRGPQQENQGSCALSGCGFSGLQKLAPVLLEGALHCLDDGEGEIRQNADQANKALLDATQRLGNELPVENVMEAVMGAMRPIGSQERSDSVYLACFRWARLLLERCPVQVLRPPVCEKLFEACLTALRRPEDEVVTTSLRLIAQLVAARDDVFGAPAWVDGAHRRAEVSDPTTPKSRQSSPSVASPPTLTPAGSAQDLAAGPARQRLSSSDLVTSTATDSSSPTPLLPSGEDFFACLCQRLFALMAEDMRSRRAEAEEKTLLSSRGELVVRELCAGVGAGRFYETAARSVASELPDSSFARKFVKVLNQVLLTSRETKALRAQLFAAATTSPRPGVSSSPSNTVVGTTVVGDHFSSQAAETCEARLRSQQPAEETIKDEVPPLLLNLLYSWFHCPVSTLALCLWLHWFELAAEVTARLARLEMTNELQAQLDDFIDLLESPVFVRVRLQMLETRRQPALLRAVLGMVALLPREQTLRARLGIVETELLLEKLAPWEASTRQDTTQQLCKPTEQLLVRFDSIADEHGFRRCVL